MDPPSSIGAIFESKTVQNRREIGDFRIVCFVSLSACGLQILQFEMGKKRRNIEKKKEVWDARRRGGGWFSGHPVEPTILLERGAILGGGSQCGAAKWEWGPRASKSEGESPRVIIRGNYKISNPAWHVGDWWGRPLPSRLLNQRCQQVGPNLVFFYIYILRHY